MNKELLYMEPSPRRRTHTRKRAANGLIIRSAV